MWNKGKESQWSNRIWNKSNNLKWCTGMYTVYKYFKTETHCSPACAIYEFKAVLSDKTLEHLHNNLYWFFSFCFNLWFNFQFQFSQSLILITIHFWKKKQKQKTKQKTRQRKTKPSDQQTSNSLSDSSMGLSRQGLGGGLKPFISSYSWWQTYACPLIRKNHRDYT